MKKLHHLFVILLNLILLVGCSKNPEELDFAQEESIEATAEQMCLDTRVGFDRQMKFYWSKQDKIGVTTNITPNMFTSMGIKRGGGTANAAFQGMISGKVGNYAVYPFSLYHFIEGTTLTLDMPSDYNYAKVDPDFFLADQGSGNSFNTPMWSTISGGRIAMKHLGAVICVKLLELPIGDNIQLVLDAGRQRVSGEFVADLSQPTPLIETANATDQNESKITITFSNHQSNTSGVFFFPIPTGTYKMMYIHMVNGKESTDTPVGRNIVIKRNSLKKLELKNGSISSGDDTGDDTGGDLPATEAAADLLFGSKEDAQNLNFNMDSDWHIEVEDQPTTRANIPDWIKIFPMKGHAGNVSISTTITTNSTKQTRKGRIKIISSKGSFELEVLQVSDEAMVVAKPKYSFGATGGSLELDVDDLDDHFTIETTVGWIKNNSLPNDNDRRLFEITENTTAKPRVGKVIFTSGRGKQQQVIEFEQAGSDEQETPGTNPNNSFLIISSQNQKFDANRHEFDVEVLSQVPFQVESPSLPWIHHVSTVGQRMHFEVDANDTYDARNALIRIYNVKNNQMTLLSVDQLQKGVLVLAKSEYAVSSKGETLHFDLGHSVEYTTDIDVDWITNANATRGLTYDPLSFQIAANPTDSCREGHIVFKSVDQTITQTILIKQGLLINEETFPDPIFRDYVSQFDIHKDGVLTQQELDAVTKIDLSSPTKITNVASLVGIKHFQNLAYLNCGENQLKTLDISQNTALTTLYCYGNQLTSLDVSQNTALTTLYCYGNQLTSLDVSQNTALTGLSCSQNQLKTLDVSQNTALTRLSCEDNQLTNLDVSQNTALTELYCNNNQLTSLDISENRRIEDLYIQMNNLLETLYVWKGFYWNPSKMYRYSNTKIVIKGETTFPDAQFMYYLLQKYDRNNDGILSQEEMDAVTKIDVNKKGISSLQGVENFKNLQTLSCEENQLTNLDVSQNTSLTRLDCNWNQLTSLDVSGCTSLTWLECYRNQLTSLDVSQNTALTGLSCSENQLTNLGVSKNTSLTWLRCNRNQLTSLDVSQNTALTGLECYRNQLTSLDVSKNTSLTSLYCGSNKLTSLDVSQNTALEYLDCEYNKIPTLDISENRRIEDLYIQMNGLLKTLYVRSGFHTIHLDPYLRIDSNTHIVIKGETTYPDAHFKYYLLLNFDTNKDGVLSQKEMDAVTKISVGGNNIHSLEGIKNFKNLQTLYCWNNQLTSLDISNNTKINTLDIRMNGLLETLYVWQGFNWNSLSQSSNKDGNTQIIVKQ